MSLKSVVMLMFMIVMSAMVFVVYQDGTKFSSITSTYRRLLAASEGRQIREEDIPWLRSYYSAQAADRIHGLEAIEENSERYDNLYNAIVPEVICPKLVRAGSVLDGGKYVCNPAAMPKSDCSIYSLGIRDEISFDRAIQAFNNYRCRIYGYDMNPQSNVTLILYRNINGIIGQARIAAATNATRNEYFIGDLLTNNNDTHTEFLKVDIEGAEHSALIPFLELYSVCQLLIEVHGKPKQHVTLLKQIARLKYALFSYEVNGNSLSACEYSFIHTDCLERYGASILTLYLKYVNS